MKANLYRCDASKEKGSNVILNQFIFQHNEWKLLSHHKQVNVQTRILKTVHNSRCGQSATVLCHYICHIDQVISVTFL